MFHITTLVFKFRISPVRFSVMGIVKISLGNITLQISMLYRVVSVQICTHQILCFVLCLETVRNGAGRGVGSGTVNGHRRNKDSG